MKMKKTMCMLAALTMALTALPAYSYADSDTSDGGTDIQWFAEPFGYEENSDGTLTLLSTTLTGKAAAVVKGKGNFAEKVSKCFIIVPKQGKVTDKKAPGKNRIKVQVRKDSQADGYEIQLSASKSFPEKTTRSAIVTGTVKTFTKLKKGKVYFIKTRSYVTVSGKKFFGKYSPVTKIRCK